MILESLKHPSPVIITIAIAALLYLMIVMGHMKGDFGPQTWALSDERPKVLRWLVYVLVWPFRLLASLFASSVVMLFIALLFGFGWAMWKVWHA